MKKILLIAALVAALIFAACTAKKSDDGMKMKNNVEEKNDMKDGMKDGMKDDMKDDMKDGMKDDMKDDMKDGMKDDMKDGMKDAFIQKTEDAYSKEFTEKKHASEYKVGEQSPDFMVKTVEGNEVKLDQILEGDKLVMFNFFTTSCGYCMQEMPDLQELAKRDDVKVVTVCLGSSPEEVKEFSQKLKLELPVFVDEEAVCAQKYLIRGVPSNFFMDGNGKLVGEKVGAMDLKTMNSVVDEMLKSMQK